MINIRFLLIKARGAGNGNGGSQSGFLNAVRSISDIGKTFSHGRNLGKLQEEIISEDAETSSKTPTLKLPEVILVFFKFSINTMKNLFNQLIFSTFYATIR